VRVPTESLLFRAIVLATIFIVATLFVTKESFPGKPTEIDSPHTEQHTNNVESEKAVFGVGAEGWTAIFTGALFVSTTALFLITVGLFKAAVKGSKDAEQLFIADQRPWLSVKVEKGKHRAIFHDDGSISMYLKVFVKNIGKTPAFHAGNGCMHYIGYEGAEDQFCAFRSFLESQSYSHGKTIFPGDTDDWDWNVTFSKAEIIQSQSIIEGCPMQFVIIGYQYKSGLTDEPLETVRMYLIGVGETEIALPAKGSKLVYGDSIAMRLWKELVS